MQDYRLSHQADGKGKAYHAKFIDNPYRAMVWGYEKSVLLTAAARHLGSRFSHLDFACGTGRMLELFQNVAARQTGVDVSESMIGVAREKMPEVELILSDITKEDRLRGRQFDLITAFRFFPNAQDELRDEAARALADLLAPNGILLFNNHKNRYSALYMAARLLRKGQRDMTEAEVGEMLDRSGLEIVESRHFGVVPGRETFWLLPIPLLRRLETWLGGIGLLRHFATNQIFVARRKRA